MMKHRNLTFVILLLPILLLFAIPVVRADTIHVVQPGDSLFRIAMTYGVSVDAIVQANNIANPRIIVLGQELIIPGVGDSEAAKPSAPPAPPSQPVANGRSVEGGVMHLIQPRDTLFGIAMAYGVPMADIIAANNIVNPRLISAGLELFIPGATVTETSDNTASAPTAPAAPAVPAPATTNLFKNPSFEEGWHYYLYNELQVPDGWQLAIDEGPNTLEPGSGGNFARPEVRVVGRDQLPEAEWDWFLFDGAKTLKAFKGDAPTTFSFFQDVNLSPGRYRMTLSYFPDTVITYQKGARIFNMDPLAGEVRVIHNEGGTNWKTTTAGQRNVTVYEFTVGGQGGITRLGMQFRNRFANANNGWFLDNWGLERLGN